MQTCWNLALGWYSGRLERDWQRPNPKEIQNLFNSLGLDGPFWKLPVPE
jgi:hypothetical protein